MSASASSRLGCSPASVIARSSACALLMQARDLHPVVAHRCVHPAGSEGVTVGIEQRDRPPQQGVHAVPNPFVGEHLRGQAGQVRLGETREGAGVGHPVPECEGTLEVVRCGGRAVLLAGQPRPHRGFEGQRDVVAGVRVECECGAELPSFGGRARLDPATQRGRVGGVHLGALMREDVVVDRLAQQRVPEREAVSPADDDVGVERLLQCHLELLVGQAGGVTQDLDLDRAAADRSEPHESSRRRRELLGVAQQQVVQQQGDRASRRPPAAPPRGAGCPPSAPAAGSRPRVGRV